jgi:hypothetical protein
MLLAYKGNAHPWFFNSALLPPYHQQFARGANLNATTTKVDITLAKMSRVRFFLQLSVLMACLLLVLAGKRPVASSTSSSNSYSSTGTDYYTGEDTAYASTGTYTKTVADKGGSASAYSNADALAGGECTTVGHCYDKGGLFIAF